MLLRNITSIQIQILLPRQVSGVTDYVVSETFPVMLLGSPVERRNGFIKFFCVPSQELSHIFNVFQGVGI